MINDTDLNLTWDKAVVGRADRELASGQRGFTIWFTGLSASGKSTLVAALEHRLLKSKHIAYRLDGDNIRLGLNSNLGFSQQDRTENVRRISQVAKLFADAAIISLTSFISPYLADRAAARKLHVQAGIPFIECWVDIPLAVAESRDPKGRFLNLGLYKKARAGELKGFTGIDAPYEPPVNPELHIRNELVTVNQAVDLIIKYLYENKLINL